MSPLIVTVALGLDYQANPLCWMMLEALRGLFQVLHRSLDLWMLLASNTVTVEALKVRRLETVEPALLPKRSLKIVSLGFGFLTHEGKIG